MSHKKQDVEVRSTESFALNSEEYGQLRRVYNLLLEKAEEKWSELELAGSRRLQEFLTYSKEWLIETHELTQLEAERVKFFLKRDLSDLAKASKEATDELQQWAGVDLASTEQRLIQKLLSVADKTQLEWLEIADELQHEGIYRTGEMTIPGKLACMQCGQFVHLKQVGHIPPCPKCHQLEFTKIH